MSFIFDDELLDDLYTAEKRKTADVRPMVKKRLKALGIKENAPTLTDLERLKKQGLKPKKESLSMKATFRNGDDKIFKGKTVR